MYLFQESTDILYVGVNSQSIAEPAISIIDKVSREYEINVFRGTTGISYTTYKPH